MALYKQPGSENWWISLPLGKRGKRLRRSSGTPDREKATAIEQALRLAHRGALDRARAHALIDLVLPEQTNAAGGIRLADAWDAFVALPEVDLAASTLRGLATQWRRFLRWQAEHWPSARTLAEITPDAAFAYADWLRAATPKAKTYNNAKDCVRVIFERLKFRAGLPANPFRDVPALRTTDSDSGRAFAPDEVDRILAAVAGTDWEGCCLVALYTGLRYTDVCHLEWDQITPDGVRLRPAKTARHGIEVCIPMHPRLRAWLDAWPRTSPHVFPDRVRRYRSRDSHTDFGAILERAHVVAASGEVVSFHSFRHTFRTRLSQAGVPKDVAQRLGGWTTDVSEIYNHDTDTLAAAIHALP